MMGLFGMSTNEIVEKYSPPPDVALSAGNEAVKPIINFAHIITGFVGVMAFIAIVYSGFLFATSFVTPDRLETAKKTILMAIVAIGVALLGEVITRFLLGAW